MEFKHCPFSKTPCEIHECMLWDQQEWSCMIRMALVKYNMHVGNRLQEFGPMLAQPGCGVEAT